MGQSDELFKYVTGKCSLEGKKKKKRKSHFEQGRYVLILSDLEWNLVIIAGKKLSMIS